MSSRKKYLTQHADKRKLRGCQASGIIPDEEFARISRERTDTRRKIVEIEREMDVVRDQITELKQKKNYVVSLIPVSIDLQDVINSIQSLKNKYADFSLDKTRIPSMRKITQEFSDELQVLIDYVKELNKK